MGHARCRYAFEVVGHMDHRRIGSERSSDSGSTDLLSGAPVRMGTGAVVRAGHGRGTVGIWRVLRVEVSCELRAALRTENRELRTGFYAESHTVRHSLYDALGRLRSPFRPEGEQRCDSLDRKHLRARRVLDLRGAGADVLDAAF